MTVNKQNYFTYIDNTSDDTDKTMKNLYKQATMDGVDVSECGELVYGCDCHLTQKYDYRSEPPYTYNKCSEIPNCHYKLYKRKEQKLDKIKETINYYSGIHCSKCKHDKTCTSIDDCVNTIIKEVLQIIEVDNEV